VLGAANVNSAKGILRAATSVTIAATISSSLASYRSVIIAYRNGAPVANGRRQRRRRRGKTRCKPHGPNQNPAVIVNYSTPARREHHQCRGSREENPSTVAGRASSIRERSDALPTAGHDFALPVEEFSLS